jgi:hypothetical protein
MSEEKRDKILDDLAILSLRRRRLSAFIAKEGLLREKRHPVSGYVYGLKAGLGVGRYSTAIDNQFFPLFDQLLYSPEELAAMAEAQRREDEQTAVLPHPLRVEPTCQTKPERTSQPFVNPTAGWFDLPKRWDHEPGLPAHAGEVADENDDPAMYVVD